MNYSLYIIFYLQMHWSFKSFSENPKTKALKPLVFIIIGFHVHTRNYYFIIFVNSRSQFSNKNIFLQSLKKHFKLFYNNFVFALFFFVFCLKMRAKICIIHKPNFGLDCVPARCLCPKTCVESYELSERNVNTIQLSMVAELARRSELKHIQIMNNRER